VDVLLPAAAVDIYYCYYYYKDTLSNAPAAEGNADNASPPCYFNFVISK